MRLLCVLTAASSFVHCMCKPGTIFFHNLGVIFNEHPIVDMSGHNTLLIVLAGDSAVTTVMIELHTSCAPASLVPKPTHAAFHCLFAQRTGMEVRLHSC